MTSDARSSKYNPFGNVGGFFETGILMAEKAAKLDEMGQHEEALEQYIRALEFIITFMKSENSKSKREKIMKKTFELITRAEQIKKKLGYSEEKYQEIVQRSHLQVSSQHDALMNETNEEDAEISGILRQSIEIDPGYSKRIRSTATSPSHEQQQLNFAPLLPSTVQQPSVPHTSTPFTVNPHSSGSFHQFNSNPQLQQPPYVEKSLQQKLAEEKQKEALLYQFYVQQQQLQQRLELLNNGTTVEPNEEAEEWVVVEKDGTSYPPPNPNAGHRASWYSPVVNFFKLFSKN